MFILALRSNQDWQVVLLALVVDLVLITILYSSLYNMVKRDNAKLSRPNYALDNMYNIDKSSNIVRRQDKRLTILANSHKVNTLNKRIDKGNNFNRLFTGNK